MRNRIGGSVLLALAVAFFAMALSASVPGDADRGDLPQFKAWSQVYDEINGDRDVVLRLTPSRFFATEPVGFHGFVRLDLIGGTANIELAELDRAVDVWLVDNKPGPGKSIVPEDGDVVIHLGRLEPSKDGSPVYLARDFGPDAFQGVEVNWVFVSDAGADPAKSRLLFATRSIFEQRYTQERLAREGFVEPLFVPSRPSAEGRSVMPSPSATLEGKAAPIVARVPHPILIDKGLVSEKVFIGGDLFFREAFEGNGRSCGTCHPVANNQTIDKPFIASLPNSDPLFIAEQVPPGHPIANLERPPLMREFGLILENVDGLQNPNVKFVMRGVPHSLSMATSITPPPGVTREQVGWSADGAPAPGRLIEFLLGAIIQHYPKNSLARVFKEDVPPGYPFDFRMPTDDELALTNEFMLNVGRLNELNINPGAMALAELRADAGRELFRTTACNGCHENASSNVAGGVNQNFITNVEKRPNPAQGFMGINFPPDGGFGQQPADCDMDGTIDPDCFGDLSFNSVGLIESADTAPFFHTNVELTIEDAVDFYNGPEFPVVSFSVNQVNDVGAFLRVINAAFNFQMAIQRNKAAIEIDPATQFTTSITDFRGIRGTANRLLLLSNVEIEDAAEVLSSSPIGLLNGKSVELAKRAHSLNLEAFNSTNLAKRLELMEKATTLLQDANARLGSGLSFSLGTGNLLF